ncbi:response regulator transcription factor [Paenibacillus daejeonensis]|uniref:response regulator transcription factor n=1 Tax=Paenibacillus daejeonensis TaxID=135193 RepID=UPI00036FFF30|nr:response regulator [Paenibacillus daejeonensis]
MYKLLIVDDEPSIVEGLAEMIASQDLPLKEIRFAYSAAEAQSYIELSPFDIILADIRMPKATGLDLVASIRAAGWNCKVILLTGYSEFEYSKKALQLGVSDYLLKPADDEEVVASIRKVIGELDRQLEEMMALEKARLKLQASASQLRHQILADLLQPSRAASGASLQATLQLLDLALEHGKEVYPVLIRIDDGGGRFSRGDAPLVRFAVQNLAEEMLNQAFKVESVHLATSLSGMLLQPVTDPGQENLQQHIRIAYIMENAQNTIFRLLGVHTSILFRSLPVSWAELGPNFRLMSDDLQRLSGKGLLIDAADQTDRLVKSEEEASGSVLIEQLKLYIVQHLNEDLSLDQLSRRFHVNPTYLSRLFKQTTNEVLSLYITKEKMGAARRLLLQDGMKVGEAANRVGYNNPNYFAKVFRNTFGMSPQEYKSRMFL